MTQRSIPAGAAPTVIIRADGDVEIEGHADEHVVASTTGHGGLEISRGSASEIARVRARVGERALFDVALPGLGQKRQDDPGTVQVKIAGSGRILVPRDSTVQVYAGKDVSAANLDKSLALSAGGRVRTRQVHMLIHASAGHAMDLEGETLAPGNAKFSSGRDLRFHIHHLTNARIIVDDQGGYWEGVIGDEERKIHLTAGGEAVLVTRHEVKPQPPHYVLGSIERPE